jgi:hypothetical protein
MSRDYREEQELAHIRAMILELERMADEYHAQRNAVLRPDYWRERIAAILVDPDLPFPLEKHATELLSRLDKITETAQRAHANGSHR